MSATTFMMVVGLLALGLCVIRFGMAMRDLEQRVSDLQEQVKRVPSA